MSLPPLPPAAVDEHNLQGGRLLYTHQQMKAYGQVCRERALDEAAQVCVQLADCEENTTNYRNGAAWCAEKIRSLK